jgi:hypothetical protein
MCDGKNMCPSCLFLPDTKVVYSFFVNVSRGNVLGIQIVGTALFLDNVKEKASEDGMIL